MCCLAPACSFGSFGLLSSPWFSGRSLLFLYVRSKHVVFGRLVQGMDVLRQMEKVDTSRDDRPLKKVTISDCGELPAEVSATAPAAPAALVSSSSSSSATEAGSSSSSSGPAPLSPRTVKLQQEEERLKAMEAKELADEQELKQIVSSSTSSDRAKKLAELKMKLVRAHLRLWDSITPPLCLETSSLLRSPFLSVVERGSPTEPQGGCTGTQAVYRP